METFLGSLSKVGFDHVHVKGFWIRFMIQLETDFPLLGKYSPEERREDRGAGNDQDRFPQTLLLIRRLRVAE